METIQRLFGDLQAHGWEPELRVTLADGQMQYSFAISRHAAWFSGQGPTPDIAIANCLASLHALVAASAPAATAFAAFYGGTVDAA